MVQVKVTPEINKSPYMRTRNSNRVKENSSLTKSLTGNNKVFYKQKIKPTQSRVSLSPNITDLKIIKKKNMNSQLNEYSTPSPEEQQQRDDLITENKKLNNDLLLVTNKLELLRPVWLSDEFVTQYFDILTMNVNSIKPTSKIFLFNPTLVHAMKVMTDFRELLDPHNLYSYDFIIMPINDNNEGYKEGGSHWSMMVYSKIEAKFYYYDSIRNYNLQSAMTVAGKLANYLNVPSSQTTLLDGPNQENSFDCGIYMLSAVDCVLYHLTVFNKPTLENLSLPNLNTVDCIKKRSFLAYVVLNRHNMTREVVTSLMVQPGVTGERDLATSNSLNIHLTSRRNFLRDRDNDKTKEEDHKKILKQKAYQEEKALKDRLKKLSPSKQYKKRNVDCNVTIVSDSHGRGIAGMLNNHCTSNMTVSGLVKPGATLEQVCSGLKNLQCTKRDGVVLLGGSNDVGNLRQTHNFKENLESALKSLKGTNVFLCNLPYRYDCNSDDAVHEEVLSLNKHICDIAADYDFVEVVDMYSLGRRYHTRQGQHLNKKGKIKYLGYCMTKCKF